MRIVLDANVLISLLLSSHPERSAAHAVLHQILSGRVTLLYVPGVIDELNLKLATRADLAARIPSAAAAALIGRLRTHAVLVQPLPEPYPSVTRDPKTITASPTRSWPRR